jgi:hypothetical protein
MDGVWIVYLFAAAIPGLILFAAVWKYVEVRRAARWPSTQGRVVQSTTEARDVRTGANSTDTERRNFAKVVYAYTVAGKERRCDRVTIGENMGDFEVAETLQRYPVGRKVTVYYNPEDPGQAVLERALPQGMGKGLAILLLVLAALVVVPVVGYRRLLDLMTGLGRNPAEAPFVAACTGFAILAALVIVAVQRNVRRMTAWPAVPGRIESSAVREFQAQSSGKSGGGRWVKHYRAEVIYSFEVAGVRYTGDKSGTAGRTSSSIPALVRRGAQRYQPGSVVRIHYNPENPAESIMDPRTGPLWLLWLIPTGMLALAYFVGR